MTPADKAQSAIIVVYHSGPIDLRRLVRSVDQDEHSIIVVDVSPTQEVQGFLTTWGGNVSVISGSENRGYAWACNLGAAYAVERGARTLIFSNPDVEFLDGSVRSLRAAALAGGVWAPIQVDGRDTPLLNTVLPVGGPIASASRWLRLGRKSLTSRRSDVLAEALARPDRVPLSSHYAISGACVAMSAETFGSLSGWSEDFFLFEEDIDLSMRCHRIQTEVGLIPTAKVIHLGGFNNRRSTRAMRQIERNSELVLWRRHDIGPASLLRIVQGIGSVARTVRSRS
jgi:GT2 family glycosyltransferase